MELVVRQTDTFFITAVAIPFRSYGNINKLGVELDTVAGGRWLEPCLISTFTPKSIYESCWKSSNPVLE